MGERTAHDPAAESVQAEVEAEVEAQAQASAEAAADPTEPGPAPKRRRSFRQWRGARPFWGGLLVTLAGAEILFTEKAALPVILHIGMMGLAGYLVPSMLGLCGLLLLFNPAQRLFYSIMAVLLALASWVTSNLGGFVIGLLLGLIGSSLAFGWLPDQPERRRLIRRRAPAGGS
ncbi:M50 family metallopeptidase [Kitasatospora viridis]|uniref:Uncharacterized protein n=1 Tax=Kitasatospora viridis TaxID=281105 RepID=A0A561UN49_9ACTN|nr:DUF6114 domain-containing protein [Kitasatospora viridis]TWG00798.1 hypothetical protein FHX73_114678 [Kitasatospora viridis]